MKKILIIISILVAAANFASAQTNNKYLTSSAGQNWFVSFGGGANIYFGEFDKHGSLGNRIAPVGKIAVGKWFTPSIGFRAQFDIAKMRGFVNPFSTQFSFVDYGLGHYYGNPDSEGYYKEKFNYLNSHIDILFSILKYRENRFFQMIPTIGLGYVFRFDSHEDGVHEGYFTANVGLINRFRLSRVIDLDFEFGGMFVNQKFDGQYGGQMLDGGFTATLGLNIKIGKTKTFQRPQTVQCDYTSYEKRIADAENNCNKRIEQLNGELNSTKQKLADCEKKLSEKPKEVVVEKPTVEETKTLKESFQSVYFETNSNVLKNESKTILDNAAAILKKYPNTQIKLSGHTDSQGAADYNKKLSQRRADAVKNYLQQQGVTANIVSVGYGEEQPVDTNATPSGRAKNRRTEIEIN